MLKGVQKTVDFLKKKVAYKSYLNSFASRALYHKLKLLKKKLRRTSNPWNHS